MRNLRHILASEGLGKTASFDLEDQAHTVLRKLQRDYQAKVEAAMNKLKSQLGKELAKLDLELDKSTRLDLWDHHEGSRLEGTVAFTDKRDQVRGQDQLREDLEAVGIYLANLKQNPAGVWSVNVGG